MTSRAALIFGVLALGLFGLSGCGGATCQSACDAIESCDPDDDAISCEEDCEDERGDATTLGCEAEFDDVVACVQDLAEACDASTDTESECGAEFQALEACAGG